MLDRIKSLCAWSILGATAVVTASCSGGNSNSGFDDSPATLINKCDQICNDVLSSCASAAGVPYNTCVSACNDLALVPSSCLEQFASYLLCVAGATSVSVTCGNNGDYVLVSPADCEDDRQATLSCNAQPGLVAACIALPGNISCALPPAGGGPNAEFCVGAPTGCPPPSPNPLGIGVYCCPSPPR
jgi:hypothetical protein